MGQTSLTQAQAQGTIGQAEGDLQHAKGLATKMQDITHTLTTGPWKGHQATVFHQKMQNYTDDFTNIVQQLQQVIDTGKDNMKAFVLHDSE